MGVRVEGNVTGNVAEVTTDQQLEITLPQTLTQGGLLVSLGDGAGGYSTAYRKASRVSQQDHLLVGIDTPEFDYNFTWTSQDTGIWSFASSTFTAAQSGGFVSLNSGTSTASGYASMQTWRFFNMLGNGELRVAMTLNLSVISSSANSIAEFGLFKANGASAPADGAFFRVTSGNLYGVTSYNGTETSVLLTGSLSANGTVDLVMDIGIFSTDFYQDDVIGGTIVTPSARAVPFESSALPMCLSYRQTGSVSPAPIMNVGHTRVDQVAVRLNIPFPHQQAGQGAMGSQAQQGSTPGSLATYTNSMAPAGAGSLSNTAALISGLGGQATGSLSSPSLNTDFLLSSFQNPAGSTTVEGRVLMISGVRIQSIITTTVTGGPVTMGYTLSYGATSTSLATTDSSSFTSPTTKGPRWMQVGQEVVSTNAAAGSTNGPGVYQGFASPISVNPGEWVNVAVKLNAASTTTTGAVTWLITFDSYWI